jgi:hypothetical protein
LIPLTHYSTSPKDVREFSDHFQTPPSALEPLLLYLPKDWIIWEPCAGKGNLVRKLHQEGYSTIKSDILTGQDFLEWEPGFPWEAIVTNPPYSIKNTIIERCYSLGRPWALLMPLTSLETLKRHTMFKDFGVEMLVLPSRVRFERPDLKKSSPWFHTAWFCHRMLPHPLIFS